MVRDDWLGTIKRGATGRRPRVAHRDRTITERARGAGGGAAWRTSWPDGRTMPFCTSDSWKRARSASFSCCSASSLDCCWDVMKRKSAFCFCSDPAASASASRELRGVGAQ